MAFTLSLSLNGMRKQNILVVGKSRDDANLQANRILTSYARRHGVSRKAVDVESKRAA